MNDNSELTSGEARLHEQAQRQYNASLWKYISAVGGILAFIAMVCSGIYFSQIALAKVIGDNASWALAISISCLELAATTLIGDKLRRTLLQKEDALEFRVATGFTGAAFVFDICTNFVGLSMTATALGRHIDTTDFFALGVVMVTAFLFGVSEIFVSWFLKALGTAQVEFKRSGKRLESIEEALERQASGGGGSPARQSQPNQQGKGGPPPQGGNPPLRHPNEGPNQFQRPSPQFEGWVTPG